MAQSGKTKPQAEQADRHILYQQAVQDVEAEIDFVQDAFQEYVGRPAKLLREDFCGTANTACEWVRRGDDHRAIAVDLDREVLAWGQANNVGSLNPDQASRVLLLEQDVRDYAGDPVDAVLAMNFSYYLFESRDLMRAYFESVRRSLKPDGIFFLDAYGGYDAFREISEPRECDGFRYIWEQASYNPIDGHMQCYIHFEFDDGSRMDRAFSYAWRLWTMPEIRELLLEAGFRKTTVYWEGTDEETYEGNGEFLPTEVADADPGWIAYIVAEQ